MTPTTVDRNRPTDDWLTDRARALAVTQQAVAAQPRSFTVSGDGRHWCFLSARSPSDHRLGLWLMDDDTQPRLIVDPDDLGDERDVPAAERAHRERTRERAAGVTSYAASPDLAVVAFAHGGRMHLLSTTDGTQRIIDDTDAVVDPRPSPTGTHVAWVTGGALHVADVTTGVARQIAHDDDPDVTWGLPEFVAAEEMGRLRGYWWSPDGSRIAVCRVDATPVDQWWLHEPVTPSASPRPLRYPAAGRANARVRLAIVDLGQRRLDVEWDVQRWPYLAAVRWDPGAPLTLAVQTRDQRELAILTVDEDDGTTRQRGCVHGDPWVELVPGVPRWSDGALVTIEDDPGSDTRRVHVDGRPHSPAGLHIDAVLGADATGIVVAANTDDPTSTALWRIERGVATPLTDITGVHAGVRHASTTVVHRATIDDATGTTTVRRDGEGRPVATVPRTPIDPPLRPVPQFAQLGRRRLEAALLLPSWYVDGPLPVLLDPYGGPHARRVRRAVHGFMTSQWFAEAGYGVLVIDGRGTPGRGLAWEHAVHGDLARCALADQHDGLLAAAERWPMLDLARVAIRGWSFGGYLAALAVLRRPDVFHAAVAGAPVTDWRLYDTHYTERYLGDPAVDPAAYDGSGLLGDAPDLRRPLLLLHGLADDNVVAAHTLQLSRALLDAGRPHTVLPLSTTTHVTREPDQVASLLGIQLRFIRDALSDVTTRSPTL
ncbi:MAG TPA: prolyl oligopeptidase family serine peptidase [Euzebyales bacterium]